MGRSRHSRAAKIAIVICSHTLRMMRSGAATVSRQVSVTATLLPTVAVAGSIVVMDDS